MKYAAIVIFVALLFLLAWKLVDKNHTSDKHYLNWHSSTFDISSDKAKVRAVRNATSSIESETLPTEANQNSFSKEFDRFLLGQTKNDVLQYQKLGFTSQAQYEETLATEFRFLMEKFQQHLLEYLRNQDLSEDQISAFLEIDDDYKSQLNEIYRVQEIEYQANYEQREKVRNLNSIRHSKMLEILSPLKLNALELETARFFKTARETFDLRAYEFRN